MSRNQLPILELTMLAYQTMISCIVVNWKIRMENQFMELEYVKELSTSKIMVIVVATH